MKITNFKYFYPERPALIHQDQELFDQLSADPDWIAEPKYNGTRLQLHHLEPGRWEFWGRHGEKLTYSPAPEVLKALDALPTLAGYWLFDGELRHGKTKGIKNKIVLYDVLIMSGELLLSAPFRDRRGALETLMNYQDGEDDETVTLPPQFLTDFRQVFSVLIQNPEYEGLVLKNLNGRLNLGRKSAVDSAWMKKVRRPNNSYHF